MRWFVKNREDTRYCRSQLFGLSRQILLRLGDHLVAAGVLDERADVVDLTVEEVLGAYDGTLIDTDLRALASARRRERTAASARPDLDAELTTTVDLPVVEDLPANATPLAPGEARTELRGLASSGGVVRYPARVVLDPSISPESCRDHIIVAKETDPGWLFLMMAARGLVVERGTLLSHTAITGRLLGVPTVVSVPGATSLIEDGALIELDGSAGTVRVLSGEQTG
jgi:pyruvate,water dikinase